MSENKQNPNKTPASPLSAEFPSGGTAAGLETMRARLLDLTNRNRLLNFRHTRASCIRIVDADPDTIFTRLLNGEEIPFRPVPEPPSSPHESRIETPEGEDAKPLAPDHAESLGWNTSYDLTTPSRHNADSRFLPLLHYVEDVETLTRKIGSAARTVIEESGTNMLYLTLGFLEWYESDDSRQAHLAPLVTVPVALNREATKNKGFQASLEYSGEDFAVNLSLVEKMRRDFAVEIPSLEEEDTPETYFARFEPILSQKKRWTILRHVTLSLLSFGKLLMYRDLDSRIWPAIAKHPLVTELFEGRKNDTITHAEEHSIDAPELKHEIPLLVVDADSSQHSALIDAMRGQNLVIEGPPGTGKSQTITNLIAAALTNGKTVLFVSEKLAALEVVRRRLDEVGLGLFCLELHSHKTRKDSLLNDVATRIKARGSFRDPKELDQQLSIAEEKKRLLTRYVVLINNEMQPFDATVFEVLWARDLAYQELPFNRVLVENVLLPAVLQSTRTDVTKAEHFLSVYAQHLAGIFRVSSTMAGHPWAWVAGSLSFQDQERVCDLLRGFVSAARDVQPVRRTLAAIAGIQLGDSIQGLVAARNILAALPDADELLPCHLLAPCRHASVRSALTAFSQAVERAVETRGILAAATAGTNASPLLRRDVADLLSRTVASLNALGLQDHGGGQLRTRLEQGRTVERTLADGEDGFSAITTLLGCPVPFDTRCVDLLLNCVLALENAPFDALHLRVPQLETEGASRIVEAAARRSHVLREQHRGLYATFNLPMVFESTNAAKLRAHAAAIEDAGFWQRWFGRDYRAARRAFRKFGRDSRKPTRPEMADGFRSLAEHHQARTEFDADTECRDLLGPLFRGIETKWDGIQLLVGWYQDVFTLLPEIDNDSAALRDVLLKSRTERLRAVNAGLITHQKQRAALEQLRVTIPQLGATLGSNSAIAGPVSELRNRLKTTNAHLEEAIAALLMGDLKPDVSVDSIGGLLKAADAHRASLAHIDSQDQVRKLLGSSFQGVGSDLGPVKAAVRFADSVVNKTIPGTTADWLLSEEYFPRLGQLRRLLNHSVRVCDDIAGVRRDIRGLAASTEWHADEAESLETLATKAERALGEREELAQWLHLLRAREESAQGGLGKLTALADGSRIEPAHLLPAFRFVFYNTLARSAFAEHPDLFGFSGVTQEQIREQFAKADKQVIRLCRERVAAIVDRRQVPYGRQSGPVKTWTELALITHEISKQKRHIPIRQLVHRSATALQGMKPCFMMGPLSVAQYLVPGRLRFDLVVMDEASQLKPEEAIGAIARGGQIVIVGDPKQLPPTNFFQRVAFDEDSADDDDRTIIEEGESILDVASTLYQPVRRLRWHYRSRHHSLIAFSNREFYQGDLVIFPSAYHESPSLGVKYHAVRGGIFEERRNVPEAEAIVDAVLDHMQDRPHESLGVVALNFEQRELIEELLDRRLRTEPFALAYQEQMDGGAEPLFVKNLENVQGDERDVIFISATYGPDAKGNQYQRFGPINGPNGHRRLNVLFTRAKKRTEVFSSLDPDKIQTTGSSAWGLRALK
ncbi:MAG: DUF4011 domain-containing protein, partial [Bryobacteraceae bacterium]